MEALAPPGRRRSWRKAGFPDVLAFGVFGDGDSNRDSVEHHLQLGDAAFKAAVEIENFGLSLFPLRNVLRWTGHGR